MFEELLRGGRIRRHQATKREVKDILQRARKDLRIAREIMVHDWDWGFAVAYNAVLQASRAYMLFKGYRPGSKEAHKSTFAFMQEALADEYKDLITYFDRMRVRRNRALYDVAGIISETEARSLLENAKQFVEFIARELAR